MQESRQFNALRVKPMLAGRLRRPQKEEDLTILIDSDIVRRGGYR